MTITDEMVEKSASELLDWDEPKTRRDAQQMARSVIAKIAPIIRSAALEEAARVADEYEPRDTLGSLQTFGAQTAANDVASAIRALKDKDTRTPTEGDLL